MGSAKDAVTTMVFGDARFGTVTGVPRCPHQGWCALGPTPFASTMIYHDVSPRADDVPEDAPRPDADGGRLYEPGFAANKPLAVEFYNLPSRIKNDPVRVEVVPCNNPFFALLVAKSSLAKRLRTTYGAEADCFLCQAGAVDVGKVAEMGVERLQWAVLGDVLRIGRCDADVLYHAVPPK